MREAFRLGIPMSTYALFVLQRGQGHNRCREEKGAVTRDGKFPCLKQTDQIDKKICALSELGNLSWREVKNYLPTKLFLSDILSLLHPFPCGIV